MATMGDPPVDELFGTALEKDMRHRPIPLEKKVTVVLTLFSYVKNGELQHGAHRVVADRCGENVRSVAKLWKKVMSSSLTKQSTIAEIREIVRDGRAKNKRPFKYSKEEFEEMMESVPRTKRGTLRSTCAALGIAETTLHRYKKMGYCKLRRIQVKPLLSERHMFNRVRFAHYHVDTPREATEKMYFKNQYNTIHIEKNGF